MNGQDAYRLVQTYAELGVHRTGWPTDAATFAWLLQLLRDDGADVSSPSYSYSYFDADVAVTHGDRVLEAMPLYYSATGDHAFVNPAIGSVDAHVDESSLFLALDHLVADAKSCGHDGLVVTTECPTGALCAINQSPACGLAFPIVLVPGREVGSLDGKDLKVRFSAQTRPETASNLLARYPGPENTRPIVVTTPVSGWFACAGERGCGLAVALHTAKVLSQFNRVDLLLASGHELGYLGGCSLANSYDGAPAAIVHIGSAIANSDATYACRCSADDVTRDKVSAALKPLNLKPEPPVDPGSPASWFGEAECWAGHLRPMLSVAGQSPHFHTPGDLPDAVTSPALLQTSLDSISEAAIALVAGVSA